MTRPPRLIRALLADRPLTRSELVLLAAAGIGFAVGDFRREMNAPVGKQAQE